MKYGVWRMKYGVESKFEMCLLRKEVLSVRSQGWGWRVLEFESLSVVLGRWGCRVLTLRSSPRKDGVLCGARKYDGRLISDEFFYGFKREAHVGAEFMNG